MVGEFVVVVRCKDCIHRPVPVEGRPYWYKPPKGEYSFWREDLTCPYTDDTWDHEFTEMPEDYWFCVHGERAREG